MSSTTTTLHKRIEELRVLLRGTADPREQLPILDELSSHLAVIDPLEAEKYARKELAVAVRIKDKRWMAEGYRNLGQSLGVRARYEHEKDCLRKAWKLHRQLPEDLYTKAMICVNLGRSYYQQGRTRDALSWIEKSFEFARKSGDPRAVASTYGYAGSIYRNLGRYAMALGFMNKALKAYKSLSYTQGIALVEWDLGQIYAGFEDWDNAIAQYGKSRLANRQVGNRQLEGLLYRGLGVAYAIKGQHKKALGLYAKACALFEELKDPHQLGQTLTQIGYIHQFQDRLDAAYESFQQAFEMFEANKSRSGQVFALMAIGEVFLRRNDCKSAIRVLSQALAIEHSTGGILQQRHAHWLLAEAHEGTGNVGIALKHYKQYMEFERMVLGNEVLEKLRAFELSAIVRGTEGGGEVPQVRIKKFEQEAGAYSIELKAVSTRLAKNTELLGDLRKRLMDLKSSSESNAETIESLLRQIDDNANRIRALKTFEDRLRKHDHAFMQRLSTRYTTLTPAELRLGSLLNLGLPNQEIADLLNVSVRTIDTHRTSIRKKLGLERGQNLIEFLSQIR